jgi:hypothetical protein
MQALKSNPFNGCKVVEFKKPMVKPQNPASATTGHDPQKHGNLAQWAAVGVALVIGVCSVVLTVYFHYADSSAKASDDHSNRLIDAKVNPAVKEINDNLTRLTGDIATLTTKTGNLQKAVETLADNQSKETQKLVERFLRAAREAKTPQVATRLLDAAASVVSVLKNEKRPASQEFFQSSIEALNQVAPELKSAAFAPSRLRKNSIRSERSTRKLSCFHNPT